MGEPVYSDYGDPLTPYLVLAMYVGIAGATLCGGYVLAEAFGLVRRGLSLREKVIMPEMDSPVMRAFLPAARALGAVERALFGGVRKPDAVINQILAMLERRLGGAGRPQGINAVEYLGYMTLASAFGAVCGATAYSWLTPNAYLSFSGYVFGGGGLGALWWWSWLSKKRAAYQNSIRRGLPFCLDLLTLAVEAGLDFTAALSRMVKKIGDTPLGREFAFMLREIQLGKVRSEALRDFARRVDVAEARTVVASLVQAEELGASLGPVLRILSAQQRERRSQRAEEQAMKAPVKILAPLVVCLFPAVLVIIGVPIIVAIRSSL